MLLVVKPNPYISRYSKVVHGGPFSIPGITSDILDFSSNISPASIVPGVGKAIQQNMELFTIYPDPESALLRDAIGTYTGVPSSQIVIGNGATEIIYNFCNAFLSQHTPVLIPIPTFGEYEAASRLVGAAPSFFKTMCLENDFEAFLSIMPKNGCTFICNPNNPTGTIISRKNLLKVIKKAQQNNTLVFVDECFIELVPGRDESVVHLVKKYNNIAILRSFTKSFALAGVRLGYCIGSSSLISILSKIKIPWNVSGIAQKAALVSLSDPTYLDKARRIIASEKKFLTRQLSKINGIQCHDTATNFFLIKTNMDSTILQKNLLKKNILVRDCKSFRGLGRHFIRVAIKTRKENKKLVEAFESI